MNITNTIWNDETGEVLEVGCYLCDSKTEPMRKVKSTSVSRGADPTEVYELDCGHSVI